LLRQPQIPEERLDSMSLEDLTRLADDLKKQVSERR